MRIATILQGSDDDPSAAGAKRRRPREAQIHNSDLFQGAEIFGDKSPADEMMPSYELETLVFLKTLRHSCWCSSLIIITQQNFFINTTTELRYNLCKDSG